VARNFGVGALVGLIFLLLLCPGCRKPRRAGGPAGGGPAGAGPKTRSESDPLATRPATGTANERPASTEQEPDEECSLSFHASGIVLDCSYKQCPSAFAATVLSADSVGMVRKGQDKWRLRTERTAPPFSPDIGAMLQVTEEGAMLTVEGAAAGNCRMPPGLRNRLHRVNGIQFTGVSIRKRLHVDE